MDIEHLYHSALELTHQMLGAVRAQDWDMLTKLEKQRAQIVEDAARAKPAFSHAEKIKIAEIIVEMERESAEIVERVQCWQEHVKILLRMKA